MIKRPLCAGAILCIVLQIITVGGFQMHRDLKPSPLEERVEDQAFVELQGVVYRREQRAKEQVLYVKNNSVFYNNQIIQESNIIVYIKQENQTEQIETGNTVQLSGTVSFFKMPTNKGQFDQKFFYQKQGIHSRIWAETLTVTDAKKYHVREYLSQLRIRWKQMFIDVLGEQDGNIMGAVLLGDKSELDPELKELYQKNGIGHILAISGLHMSFMGVGLYGMLRKRGVSFCAAGLAGILFLSLYTLMIGGGVSSLRAMVMFAVRMGAEMTGRVYDMLTALAAAALVLVMWKPLYIFDAGFLLSFGAVLGIGMLYPRLMQPKTADENRRQTYGRIVKNSVCASVSIQIMILPVQMYFYYEVQPYAPLLNLAVVPCMSMVLTLGIWGSVVYIWLPGIGNLMLQGCRGVFWFYQWLCEGISHIPGFRVVTGQPEIWQIVACYVLLAMALWITGKQNQWKQKMGVFLAAATTAAVCFIWGLLPDGLRVTVMDVGQGDGIFLRGPTGVTYLYDGGSSDVKQVGKYRIEPYVKSVGAGTIDYVFVSHGDSDHINGIEELVTRQKWGVKIKNIVFPEQKFWTEELTALAKNAAEQGIRTLVMRAGQKIEEKELSITCLAPKSSYSGETGNASSLVLDVTYKACDILLTGDVEGRGEQELESILRQRGKMYDILKVAHHGSKNSTKHTFLEVCPSTYAVISAGRDNRYGHPHEETIQRLQENGSRIITTQESGAIMLWTDGEQVAVETYQSSTN